MGVSKRGVSTIVATVILILITLVAIFLLWFFLRPTISTTGEKLGTAADCINVRVEPVSCKYYKSKPDTCNGVILDVGVRRTAGSGDYNSIDLLFIKNQNQPFNMDYGSFNFGNKSRLTETQYGNYGHFFFNPSPLRIFNASDTLNSFNTAVLVGKDKHVCNPLTVPIPCTEVKQITVDADGDLNGDQKYDFFDFTSFVNAFPDLPNEVCDENHGDFNNDGECTVEDYFAFCSALDNPPKP